MNFIFLLAIVAFMVLAVLFTLVGLAIFIQRSRHANISSRLKALEEKLGRAYSLPNPPASM